MSLIHDNQIELFLILVLISAVQYLRQATIGDELCFLIDIELLECPLPIIFQSRRVDYQHIGMLAIRLDETFGYHGGNHGLSQTYYIGQYQSVMPDVLKEFETSFVLQGKSVCIKYQTTGSASTTLNGAPIAGNYIPYEALQSENEILVTK